MRETGTNVAEHMRSDDHASGKLMTLRDVAARSIMTTHTLSLDHLQAQRLEAANLSLLWLFLDCQILWYGLLASALQGLFDKI